MDPHDLFLARATSDQRGKVVSGDGQRHGAKLHFLGDAKRALHDAAIGGCDHDLTTGGRRGAVTLVGKQEVVERGVVARKRQVPLELEADHLAHFASERGQLDRLHGDRCARQGERDRADGQATLLDLRAERLDGILRAHDEDLDAPSLHCGSNETIAEQKNSKVSPSKHHKIRLR